MKPQCIAYHIDQHDMISHVDESWDDFARNNKAESLTRDSVLGKPLSGFIGDAVVKHLYSMLLNRVRHHRQPLYFSFRCDAPHLRRFMQMEISSLAASGVALNSCIVREEPREPVALLDPDTAHSDDFLKICSFCKKVKLEDDGWAEVETAIERLHLFDVDKLPALTHGICPPCHADYRLKLLNN